MNIRAELALAEGVEVGEELGEADGGGFGSVDFGVAFCAQGCDGEGHGDAVVGAGVDLCAVEVLVAGDVEAVFVFGEVAPMALRFLATRAMRSDSLTRSSRASRMVMPLMV